MKNILHILLFSAFSISGFSQDYQSRINDLNKQLETAISLEDFEKASEIKKQRNLYVELQNAVENEDFKKASQLKAMLNGKSQPSFKKGSDENAVVYLYAGNMVGSIGGYIEVAGAKYELRHSDVTKVVLPAGSTTFKTNNSDGQGLLTRDLEAGKIYFLEFGNKTGRVVKIPTLRFTTFESFKSNLDFVGYPDKVALLKEISEVKEEFKDSEKLSGDNLLYVRFESSCKLCDFEINGVSLIDKIKKNVTYQVKVPNEELFVTYIWDAMDQDTRGDGTDRYEPMFFENLRVDPKSETFLLLEGTLSGKAWVKEVDKATFNHGKQSSFLEVN